MIGLESYNIIREIAYQNDPELPRKPDGPTPGPSPRTFHPIPTQRGVRSEHRRRREEKSQRNGNIHILIIGTPDFLPHYLRVPKTRSRILFL